ncbi:NADH:flavin oxidoreductase [Trinickia violacea]|uniref:NADH:flavin oxidoreductase n=1 Tax=Trinickia violacea TaxID=2571746 RepID=A0A4V1EHI0_9BURK|nr:NADH:flavin oxidoreductase [Trinickia violacea]QCP50340.1 NADH:flavin oxidoreductase [Trinickia violacea]
MTRQSLSSPLTIRTLTVPNRVAMSPMTRGFCPDGAPTEEVAKYYSRRAAGGCGLIITEAVGIDHPSALGDAGLGEDNIPVLHGDAPVAGWRRVVETVHAAGGRIVPQLWHQGALRLAGTGPNPEARTLSPSGVWGPLGRMTSLAAGKVPADRRIGEPMRESEIDEVIEAYVRSARNATLAGFDGVAIHGAHGYLIDTFLWDETNVRNDRWGGDHAQRTAFAVEVVRRIRQAIGPLVPIFFRFSQWKQQDFRAQLATTPQELEQVLGPLADAGVDVFDASVRYFDKAAYPDSDLSLAGWAKKVTGKLSMAVGGVGINKGMYDGDKGVAAVDNVERVVSRLMHGEFDLVAVGRAVLGDAEWARKAIAGEAAVPFDPNTLSQLA